MLANAKAGRGRGRVAAQRIADRLRAGGYRVAVLQVGPGMDPPAVAEQIAVARVVVAAGGDGTVMHAAAAMLARRCVAGATMPAIYHLPWGNENLFAREFGMDRHAATLLAALGRRAIARVDVAWIRRSGHGGPPAPIERRPFLIMAGFGPDASVIRRLDAARSSAIGHLAYVRPILAELRDPTFPRVRVTVDGRRVVDDEPGMLIVANCRRYASRLDPAREASMTDGLLDAVFMPCRTVPGAVGWAVRCRLRRQAAGRGWVSVRGSEVTVERLDRDDLPCQVDGESVRTAQTPTPSFTISVEAEVLPVLKP